MYLKVETKYRYPLIHSHLGCDLRTKSKREKTITYEKTQQYKESNQENVRIHYSLQTPINVP